eukprot:scaffold15697_cov40-Cyclotella_meneghiniana.AAC.5
MVCALEGSPPKYRKRKVLNVRETLSSAAHTTDSRSHQSGHTLSAPPPSNSSIIGETTGTFAEVSFDLVDSIVQKEPRSQNTR